MVEDGVSGKLAVAMLILKGDSIGRKDVEEVLPVPRGRTPAPRLLAWTFPECHLASLEHSSPSVWCQNVTPRRAGIVGVSRPITRHPWRMCLQLCPHRVFRFG